MYMYGNHTILSYHHSEVPRVLLFIIVKDISAHLLKKYNV